jgi:A/G-specific adenine glycosylase
MARLGGEIPGTWDELISLPGIGSYTASAILSFAFGQSVPTVDGNVRRVLSRLLGIQERIDTNRGQRKISETAAELIPQENPALFNHGIMDLGATICTPRRPSCTVCPVQGFCMAYKKGLQETLPITRKKRPLPHKQMTAAIIADRQRRLLIVQRPPNGLLGGLWKFPGGLCEPEETIKQGLRRIVREELGIQIRVQDSITSVEHAFTHFRITLYAFRCARRDGKLSALRCNRYRWVRAQNLGNFPFSRADRKVIEAL